jgi:hypothetical protein
MLLQLSLLLQGRAERAVRLAARVILGARSGTGIRCELDGPDSAGGRDAPAGTLAVTGLAAPP